jgi:hypothetical protein
MVHRGHVYFWLLLADSKVKIFLNIITEISGERQEIFPDDLARHMKLPRRGCSLASMNFGWVSEIETVPDYLRMPQSSVIREIWI